MGLPNKVSTSALVVTPFLSLSILSALILVPTLVDTQPITNRARVTAMMTDAKRAIRFIVFFLSFGVSVSAATAVYLRLGRIVRRVCQKYAKQCGQTIFRENPTFNKITNYRLSCQRQKA